MQLKRVSNQDLKTFISIEEVYKNTLGMTFISVFFSKKFHFKKWYMFCLTDLGNLYYQFIEVHNKKNIFSTLVRDVFFIVNGRQSQF